MNTRKRGVMYVWAITVLVIVVVGLLWFILDSALSPMYTMQLSLYPSEMSDPGVTFINAIWTYWPVFVLAGLGIWVYERSQKERLDDMTGR